MGRGHSHPESERAMNAESALRAITATRIVAGMRGDFPPDVALRTSQALMGEGIRCFEMLMNSQQPIAAMQALKAEYGDAACVGMGTVLSAEAARQALDAGADFIVSPAFQPEVVQVALDGAALVAPGVATATEAVAAWQMGLPLLKLFPIGALGVDYFAAIFGPLGHMRFMCNGAMNDQNARELIQAGAVAVGMGGWLVGDGSWGKSRLRSRARILVNAVGSVED